MRDIQKDFEDAVARQQFEHVKVDLTRDTLWPETYRYESTQKAWTYFLAGFNAGMN